MGIMETVEKYFNKLNDYTLTNDVNTDMPYKFQPKKVFCEPNFTLTDNKFVVYVNGEKVEVLINKGTIYVNTTLNIVINSGLVSLSGDNGVHLNPPNIDVDEMKRTYELSKMMEPEAGECTNCKEPVKRITNE